MPSVRQHRILGAGGIFELLQVTEDIQKLILEKKDSNIIKERARKNGMRTFGKTAG